MLEKKLAELSGGRILDVATDAGRFIDRLIDAFKDFEEVIGVDIAEKKFEEARERLKDNPVSFAVMDGAHLKFADESFDTVAMAAGMHHLDDIPAVLSEMMRVLKPGGTLVIREMYRDVRDEKHKTDVLQHDWYARIDRLLGRPHFPTLTEREIVDYAEGLGLSRLDLYKHFCDDCPRSKGETVQQEIVEMDEHLAKIKDIPEHEELTAERDRIADRLKAVGVCCQPAVDVLGTK